MSGRLASVLAAAAMCLLPVLSRGANSTLVNLHSFDLFLNGNAPYSSLVQGSNGLFYGTTTAGGASRAGVVYQVAGSGVMSVLYSFTNGVDGDSPQASLVFGNDGNLYGTTIDGGTNGTGSIFRISTSGSFTPLYSFEETNSFGFNATGANPTAGLVQASDGNLYGVAEGGGASGSGTLFKMTLGGAFSVVYTFSGLGDGAYRARLWWRGRMAIFTAPRPKAGQMESGPFSNISCRRIP